jgi:hypothetical protein
VVIMAEQSTIDIAAAVTRLKAHRATHGYLPEDFIEAVATLLYGSARLGRWSMVAKAMHDLGAAAHVYAALFPGDRWMVGYRVSTPDRPAFDFACFPPPAEDDPPGLLPPPICETAHEVGAIAIILAALERRRLEMVAQAQGCIDDQNRTREH